MPQDTDIFDSNPDNDTLGGRLWRAREAIAMSETALAKALGLKKETLRAWESDRSEPRANKLVTLAGLLNVSPTWLLYGVGDAPQSETIASELSILRSQLQRIRDLREQTDAAIANMEKAIDKIAKHEGA
ncbi:MAG: helix-turn-helix domain-containing protein [Salaquimonas sp.]|nr:helix-turn-helix domain-containing protein [Salaquimonas sp.]